MLLIRMLHGEMSVILGLRLMRVAQDTHPNKYEDTWDFPVCHMCALLVKQSNVLKDGSGDIIDQNKGRWK